MLELKFIDFLLIYLSSEMLLENGTKKIINFLNINCTEGKR